MIILFSCQKEGDSENPAPESDSFYIKRVLVLRANGTDTLSKVDFEYDARKRLSKKTVLEMYLKNTFQLFYDAESEHPSKIIHVREDLFGGDMAFTDTSYLFYQNSHVVLDSSHLHADLGGFQPRIHAYEVLSSGIIRTTFRRYYINTLQSTATAHSRVEWIGDNLTQIFDTISFSTSPAPPQVYTYQFTYDNSKNPFNRIRIPYFHAATNTTGLEDLSFLSTTVNPSINNVRIRTYSGGLSDTITYQYNAYNLPVTATTTLGQLSIKYYYTDL